MLFTVYIEQRTLLPYFGNIINGYLQMHIQKIRTMHWRSHEGGKLGVGCPYLCWDRSWNLPIAVENFFWGERAGSVIVKIVWKFEEVDFLLVKTLIRRCQWEPSRFWNPGYATGSLSMPEISQVGGGGDSRTGYGGKSNRNRGVLSLDFKILDSLEDR